MERNKSKVTPINRVLTTGTSHVVAPLLTSPSRPTLPAFNVRVATLASSSWTSRGSSNGVRALLRGCLREHQGRGHG